MDKKISQELLSFIQKSPTSFHVIDTMKDLLNKEDFIELKEYESWEIKKGGKYYVTRNDSSIIVFTIGNVLDDYHFQLTASHSDSPTFKVKANAELKGKGGYLRLNTDGYGGMICPSWMDRPLSLAGRVIVKEGNMIKSKLISFDKDLVLIPNVAIHLNRSINSQFEYNKQIDMIPLFSTGECQEGDYYQMIANELNINKEDIYGLDIYLVNRTHPTIWGLKDEFISSPKLDDLQCAFSSLKAILSSHNKHAINVMACFDNEEVGSGSKQGALSTFLYDTLNRINDNLGYTKEDYYKAIAKSFMISCDNAHAVHPNHSEKTDETNCTYMNQGIVIKHHANQKYTTDGYSHAIFKAICKKAQVPFQEYENRSDIVGGSTLGNLSNQKVSLHSIDIGLAQLAMHSSYETAGTKDTYYLVEALKMYYSKNILIEGSQMKIQ